MGHPDFRAGGRIFATLRDEGRLGMVGLTPEQQQSFVAEHPSMFEPEAGAWGRQGSTRVVLERADAEVVGEALTLAWQNAMAKATPSKQKPPRTAAPKRAAVKARIRK